MRPQPRVRNKKAHERSHHGHTGNPPAFPAQWFYGLLRALPGDQACLTPSPALLLADLPPASGRQNDTTWPSASAPFVKGTTASTASRPASMTLANAPLSGRDGANQWSDLGPLASEISENQKFVGGGWRGWCAGWAGPTGRANARPIIGSPSPPSSQMKTGRRRRNRAFAHPTSPPA